MAIISLSFFLSFRLHFSSLYYFFFSSSISFIFYFLISVVFFDVLFCWFGHTISILWNSLCTFARACNRTIGSQNVFNIRKLLRISLFLCNCWWFCVCVSLSLWYSLSVSSEPEHTLRILRIAKWMCACALCTQSWIARINYAKLLSSDMQTEWFNIRGAAGCPFFFSYSEGVREPRWSQHKNMHKIE